MNSDCLKLKNIEKSLGSKKILSGVNFSIAANEIVGLLGPNGAGKTTAFYIAAGIIFPSEGQIFINNKDVTDKPMHARANLGLGYLPQEASIFPELSVEKNLLGIVELSMGDQDKKIEKLSKIVDEFGLKNILQAKGRMLSGGQRRKVEIARTLICEPDIVLLDEPFAGIDPLAIEDIKNVLKSLADKGICILITDHNLRETIDICNYSIVIKDGGILDKGEKDYLINSSLIKEEYFGTVFD